MSNERKQVTRWYKSIKTQVTGKLIIQVSKLDIVLLQSVRKIYLLQETSSAPLQKPSTTKIGIHEENNFELRKISPISDVQGTK